ncbi:MAG: hypothetical protein QM710_12840 [Flavobacterium sp.]
MKKLFLALILIFSAQILSAQTYEFTRKFTPEEKRNFLGLNKDLFKLANNFSFNISTLDMEMKIEDMMDQVPYDKEYLKKKQALLQKDSLNPIVLNDVAEYYQKNNDPVSARNYYQKAYKNLPRFLEEKKKDSANYYSFRGMLKTHLDMEPLADMEKALKINPLDSLANTFYPMLLIFNGHVQEARQLSLKKIDANEWPQKYYIMLYMPYLFEIKEILSDETKRKIYSQKEYDQLIDYSLLNKYAAKYKNNIQIQNARNMIEAMALFYKMLTFKTSQGKTALTLNFSEREKNKMTQLVKVFTESLQNKTINSYSGNRYLALLYYMQNKMDMALESAQKAVAALPLTKQSVGINSNEVYDLMLNIYNTKNDYAGYQKTVEEKMEKGFNDDGFANEYLDIATVYLLQNDLEKAGEWCRKSKAVNAEDFKCLSLLAHIYFLNDNQTLSQFYSESAVKYVTDKTDSAYLNLRIAIYLMLQSYEGTAKAVYDSFNLTKKELGGDCQVCDDLLAKYITVKP